MKIAMAQINPTVGDFPGNTALIRSFLEQARQAGVKLVVFPELAVTGYPPQDLVTDPAFVDASRRALESLVPHTTGLCAVVGFVDPYPQDEARYRPGRPMDAAAVMEDGRLLGVQHKTLLPTYDVFDEGRYFTPAREHHTFDLGETLLGVEICEDLWDQDYQTKVTRILADRGARLVVVISASPFHVGKGRVRLELMQRQARDNRVAIVNVNLVGGQDELVFDGHSLAVDFQGRLIAQGPRFCQDLVVFDLPEGGASLAALDYLNPEPADEMYRALVLGIQDYFHKSGFSRAVMGLSGGIDSSVTACIAVAALGKENVVGVCMPSPYSSSHSLEDARELAENLGISHQLIPILPAMQAYREILAEPFRGRAPDITEENLQARIRGNILMALSNKFGYLVLSTGNKTEVALGYATLYGDMCGGLAAISDVSKLEVYELARYINSCGRPAPIPERAITKVPSAELREGQFDPFDYQVVSPLVDEIIEHGRGSRELIDLGYEPELVHRTIGQIRRAEYKRRQAPPGIKITPKAFGLGRRMPLVNKFEK